MLTDPDALFGYQFHSQTIRHYFCRRCGIKPFGADIEGFGEIVAVNIACLDNISDAMLAAAPITCESGRTIGTRRRLPSRFICDQRHA